MLVAHSLISYYHDSHAVQHHSCFDTHMGAISNIAVRLCLENDPSALMLLNSFLRNDTLRYEDIDKTLQGLCVLLR